MKINLRQRLQTGAKNVPSMKYLAATLFFMSYIYCKITSDKLMINYHSHCYFCKKSAILNLKPSEKSFYEYPE